MKKLFAPLMIACAVAFASANPAFSQKAKGGKVVVVNSSESSLRSKTYKLQSVSGIKAGSVFDIEITRGRSGKVTISAPSETLEHIIVSESGGILTLRLENGYNISNSKSRWYSRTKNLKGPIKVSADIQSLSSIDLSGAAKLTAKESFSEKNCDIELSGATKVSLSKLNASSIKIDMSGASELSFTGSFETAKADLSGASKLSVNGNFSEKLDADLSGASKLTISGKTDRTELECSGASVFSGAGFVTKDLAIEMSGASKVAVGVQKRIAGEVSGASSLVYYGDPDKVIIEKSHGASVGRK